MLTIRKEQMAVFEVELRRQFADRVAAQMKSHLSTAQSLIPEQALERVRMLVEVAGQHGLHEGHHVSLFVEQMFDRASWAMQDPGILQVLRSIELTAAEKLVRVADLVKSQGGE